jgi:hypothetical protein
MQKMGAKRLVLLAGLAGSLVWASAANAVTIDIGLAQNDASIGAVVDQHSSTLSPGTYAAAPGFTSISATTTSDFSSSQILLSNSINVAGTATNTLYLYVTMQGITGAVLPFTSVFQQGLLPVGAKVVQSTYIGLSNELWTGTLIGTATFSGPGSFSNVTTAYSGPAVLPNSPISVTELFAITLGHSKIANSTILINGEVSQGNTVPLPAALPLFGSVLGGGGLLFLRRNRRKA